jgi:hypothetical protein
MASERLMDASPVAPTVSQPAWRAAENDQVRKDRKGRNGRENVRLNRRGRRRVEMAERESIHP